ncbi:MAG TPA: GYF domain-containing protein [Polyangiaceae bacterium]|nr:GYF domain-containing protein [Polyangiaceae bacterium]
MKFLCDQCKAKYQIADEKVVGKTVRMKCRKCGHLIEVRAAVTESSAVSVPPAGSVGTGSSPPARSPPKPAPPRSTPLAASLTSARPAAPKPDRLPSTLAGTFKTTVQREEEVSAPFDMSELSPTDDWYVAINGVPVGPIRIGEIRRKASLGAVTVDSLVWQEGLDEWRPLRTFADLAAIVREAATSGRASLTPPPAEARSSVPPPPARPASTRPLSPAAAPRTSLPRPTAPPRNNVVPIMSRLATAERIDEGPALAPAAKASPFLAPAAETRLVASVAPDPFAFPAPPTAVGNVVGAIADSAGTAPPVLERGRRSPPWFAIAMVAAAAAFGVTTAVTLSLRTNPPPPQPVVVQVPVPAAAAAPTAASSALAPVESVGPMASAPPPAKTPGGAALARSTAPAPATSGGRSLDLHGLTGSTNIAPTDEPSGGESAAATGQCISQGQLLQVIGQHQVAVRRTCWDRNQNTKPTVGVSVSMTIANDGSAQGVVASGDDPAVAKCIENDVRAWHFPPMGCSQKVNIPFKFVRQ